MLCNLSSEPVAFFNHSYSFDVYQNTTRNDSDGAVEGSSDSFGAMQVPEPPGYILWPTVALLVTVFVVGVVGNLLVIVVVWRNQDMRNSTNFFLVNLSVADLLVIVVCMPPALVDILEKEQWKFGPVMCECEILNIYLKFVFFPWIIVMLRGIPVLKPNVN